MSLNKVMLIGNLTRDPEIKTNDYGRKMAFFSVATSDKWTDKKTGEKKEKTEFHRVCVYTEGLAGIVESYVKKGCKVYIEGALQTRKWSDNDGVEKYTTEIILQGFGAKIEILTFSDDGKRSDDSSAPDDEIPW
jgi:single-strand DNA-binding protein